MSLSSSITNRVLARFREIGDLEFPENWIAAIDCVSTFGGYREWDDPRSYFHVLTVASGAEMQQARQVLCRLGATS